MDPRIDAGSTREIRAGFLGEVMVETWAQKDGWNLRNSSEIFL